MSNESKQYKYDSLWVLILHHFFHTVIIFFFFLLHKHRNARRMSLLKLASDFKMQRRLSIMVSTFSFLFLFVRVVTSY